MIIPGERRCFHGSVAPLHTPTPQKRWRRRRAALGSVADMRINHRQELLQKTSLSYETLSVSVCVRAYVYVCVCVRVRECPVLLLSHDLLSVSSTGSWRWAAPGCGAGRGWVVTRAGLSNTRSLVRVSSCARVFPDVGWRRFSVSIPQDKQIISERMLKLRDSVDGQIKNQTLCKDVK